MTTETTLFGGDPSNTQTEGDDLAVLSATTDPDKDYFEELVGDEKQYKTPQDIARGKVEGDLHIKRLERELAGLRNELSSKSSVEALLTEMKSLNETPANVSNDGMSNPGEQAPGESGSVPNITPDDIEKMVAAQLQKERSTSQADANFNLVREELTKNFGNESTAVLQKLADNYSMSQAQINDLARNNPKALLALLPQASAPSTETPANLFSAGNIDSQKIASPTSGSSGKRDWAYYEKIRQTDPETYWSRETQDRLHKDAIALREEF